MRSHDNSINDDILDSSIVVDAPLPFYTQDGDGDGDDHFNRAYFGLFYYYLTSTFIISFH